jgi:TolB protein
MNRAIFAALSIALFFALTGLANAAFPGANGKLAYASNEFTLDLDVFVIPATGGKPDVITSSSDDERYPAWSPNGQRIAFERDRKGPTAFGPEIWVMNANGSGKKRLAAGGQPTWSPDGAKIAFVGGSPGDVHVMNADGSNDTTLAQGFEPAWSPDGTKIAFTRDNNIFVMNAAGGGEAQLTFDGAHNQNPDWSPDSSSIVFARFTGDYDLAVVPAGGGTASPLADNAQDDWNPAWSPDGTKIVFETGWPEADSKLRVVNADGSGLKTVRQSPESGNSEPSWQPRPVTLTASKKIVRFGNSTTLRAHLYFSDSTTNSTVSLYKTPAGGAKTLMLSKEVDGAGNVTVPVSPSKKTLYTVTWSGDASHPGSSASLTLEVRSITKTRLSHYYAKSGKFHLYRAGAEIRQTGKVIPNHAGRKLTFYAERRTNGVWDILTTASFRISRRGSVRAVIHLPEGTYRFYNLFPGDFDHLGSASARKYVRVTS